MKQKAFFIFTLFILSSSLLYSQSSSDLSQASRNLPLRRVSILSSGIGFFEHSGTITGAGEVSLLFDASVMNDVLSSLVLNDPASSSPSLLYNSEGSLWRSLRSLRVDLAGNPGFAEILGSQRGEEIEVYAPEQILGRIIGVEYRHHTTGQFFASIPWLIVLTSRGISSIPVEEIRSFRFFNDELNSDLLRALDLLASSHDELNQNIRVVLDGQGSRAVSISYVIPSAVWKVSYRLDLSGTRPFLQGWAIVDNDSDTDWEGVELSLLTGRPVSFIQMLYPPYRVFRPVLPLSIAGIAESAVHDSALTSRQFSGMAYEQAEMLYMAEDSAPAMMRAAPTMSAPVLQGGGALETAGVREAGDQFEFTIRSPVTLPRRQSAMLPLVEGNLTAERTLIFQGTRVRRGETINPQISVEITNTLGMGLPAGPITVFDGGTYAGDALLEFLPENEKRLISFGEDLSVTGSGRSSGSRFITGVSISGGVMTVNRRQRDEWVYTIRNASGENKRIIIEHPITGGSELTLPAHADEQTANLYRFNQNLRARDTLIFTVREETPIFERITLSQMRPEVFISYSTNTEIPANVRSALSRAIELRRVLDNAEQNRSRLESERTMLFSEQDRIRRNLEAVGAQSTQGQEYLRRMTALDIDIDNINRSITEALNESRRARSEYDSYIAAIEI
ncbi:MAG: DUF4139 domain-containing protein [Treponema sp.]|nr:DUF4139 domain-containing protein [Treponema sp.]